MKKKVLLCSFMILFVLVCFSQEKGQVGFLFKTGTLNSVGMTFNLSNRVALRPSIGFSTARIDIEDETLVNDPQKSDNYNASLGILYDFLKKENLSVYSGLEFGYSHSKIESNVCSSFICSLVSRKMNGFTGDVILGFRYNLNKHLALFGEIGFGYERLKTDIESNLPGTTGTEKYKAWDLSRSGVGVTFYL